MLRLCAFILATMLMGQAHAAPRVQVAPVIIEIGAKARVASFRVRNTSQEPAAFSALTMSWTQDNGEDVLTETNDFLVSPPAFVVPPGGTQIVRVGLADAGGRSAERAYRVILRETPLQTETATSGLRMRLELSMPVFALPEGKMQPDITFAVQGQTLRIANTSNRHMRLIELDMATGATPLAAPDLPRYLLAGEEVAREIAGRPDTATLTFMAPDASAPQTRTVSTGGPFPIAAIP